MRAPGHAPACAKDDDCDLDWTYLVDGQCCNGTCSPKPASKRHVQAVAQQCKTLGFTMTSCPMKKCAALPPVRCVARRCVFVPARSE